MCLKYCGISRSSLKNLLANQLDNGEFVPQKKAVVIGVAIPRNCDIRKKEHLKIQEIPRAEKGVTLWIV